MPFRLALFAAALGTAVPAFAHPGHAGVSGFLHPLSGPDHVLAMVSIGLWAAVLGGRALWLVPASFVACMTGFFAVFHGYAHGSEPVGAAWSFGLGFVAATALLHLAGIGLGRVLGGRRRLGGWT